ncbi:MAG: MBL fold metallo-hydrolase [bacterium]|nr:MBL fold metallo-hydrolase [bacterium]
MKSDFKSSIVFWGGVRKVTGSNFLLDTGKERILVDCGLIQGENFAEDENRKPFPYDPSDIDICFITHAHIDHIGRVPKLVRDGFKGRIISTAETKAMASFMFEDAISIMEREKKEPLYAKEDALAALALWDTYDYREWFGAGVDLRAIFKDAGHILGSAIVILERNGKSMVFSGDLGNSPSPLLNDTEKVSLADYMVVESVYGDRNHENRSEREENFERVIRDVISKKGTLLIPSFSIEKTQILLHKLNDLVESGSIKDVKVFLDSPLAVKVTEIYRRMPKNLNNDIQKHLAEGDDIFSFPMLKVTESSIESREIVSQSGPKIVIAGSGMSSGGRIVKHEERLLPDPSVTILFVGYQAVGSLGREIQDGLKEVKIGDKKVRVRAKIVTINGYSSHKDGEGLLEFVSNSAETLKKVFVAMGEPKASMFLAQRIRDYLCVEAVAPKVGDKYEIEF